MKKKIFIILSVVAGVIVLYFIVHTLSSQGKGGVTSSLFKKDSGCGLVVLSPKPNSIVSGEIDISAVVDNRKKDERGCSWGVFEAQAGTVIVRDMQDEVIVAGVLTTNSEWMTTDPVTYTSHLTIPSEIKGPVTLSFVEDNSADVPTPDSYSFKLTIK